MNIAIRRDWLCFSPTLQKPYCHTCCLFADRAASNIQWSRINGVDGSPRHYEYKAKKHEQAQVHTVASAVFCRHWKVDNRIDKEQEKNIQRNANIWCQVLCRIINIILTLALLSLVFRGHRETVRDGICEGGNFVGLVYMQAQFDPLLKNLISLPSRAARNLSGTIQSEIVGLLGKRVRQTLLDNINASPFFRLLSTQLSDITRVDQVSLISRWVKQFTLIQGCEDDTDIEIIETFLRILPTIDATAAGITKTVVERLREMGLNRSKIRGQGYDGAVL